MTRPTTATTPPMTHRPTGWLRRDDGVSALEAAILAPALLAMIVLAIVVMRIEVANESVSSSAHDAARAASISRTAGEAAKAATDTATATLHEQGLTCRSLSVHVDTSQFALPVGEPAAITVTITCVADFSDIALPGMPGQKTLTATFVSYLDQYRGRS